MIRTLLQRHGVAERRYEAAVHALQRNGRVALHFHPERLDRTGRSVAAGLLESGLYRSQFETGLSSGSPSAFPGGERDGWEQRLFSGAYHSPGVSSAERPKYGSLYLVPHPDGPSPRFGSCYLLLTSAVSRRSTFTFGGSQEAEATERSGTLDLLDPAMAPLLAGLERNPRMLGPDAISVRDLLERLPGWLTAPGDGLASRPLGRVLDHFIEAQLHGEVALSSDVDRLVADAAFEGHPIGDLLHEVARKHGFPLAWHPGFRLALHEVPQAFRGYALTALAARAAVNGLIDAASLGACANSLALDPAAWSHCGAVEDTVTRFRRLWHVLVLGRVEPRDEAPPVR